MWLEIGPRLGVDEDIKHLQHSSEYINLVHRFTAKRFTTGYYINSINGQEEKQVGYWFWLLYRLDEPPVPGVKPPNSLVNPAGKRGCLSLVWVEPMSSYILNS